MAFASAAWSRPVPTSEAGKNKSGSASRIVLSQPPAFEMLDAMGMEAFAERARRELAAAGETARKRTVHASHGRYGVPGQVSEPPTAQEAQAARLAIAGLSTPEIGSRVFIGTRTVQYHLSKVLTKLGISSRGQLHRVRPG